MNSEELSILLFNSTNYRHFLAKFIEQSKNTGAKMSYRALATRAGFASKSYLRDVQIGEKRLTQRSLPKLMKALRMSEDLKKYFTLFVSLEEKELNVSGLTADEIQNRLLKIKNRISAKKDKQQNGQSNVLYQTTHWLEIYASLGSTQEGASLAEISQRSKLPKQTVEKIIGAMVEKEVVLSKKEKFFPLNGHLIFDGLGENEFFHKSYLESVKNLQKEAGAHFHANDRLFLNSVFSIKEKQMPQFRQELREFLLRFVDSAEDPDGDCLAKLVIGFAPNVPATKQYNLNSKKN